ncbi:hypothetical protein E8E11_002811 [Didymella keratinophila]|nr:hypothetical protein E8E11_002811 [Didymella keratinophila]
MKFTLTILTTLLAVAMAAPSASTFDTEALEKRCYGRGSESYIPPSYMHPFYLWRSAWLISSTAACRSNRAECCNGAYPFDDSKNCFPCKFLTLVTLLVGEHRITRHVHKAKLTLSSDFFMNALNKDWKESYTSTIEMPDCDTEYIDIYVEWLYSGRMCVTKDPSEEPSEKQSNADKFGDNKNDEKAESNDSSSDHTSDETAETDEHGIVQDAEWTTLAKCYALGSFLQDTGFRDATIDAIMEKMVCDDLVYADLAKDAYAVPSTDSPHRKLAIDIAINVWPREMFAIVADRECPPRFQTDLITAMGNLLRDCGRAGGQSVADFFASVKPCQYHEHTMTGTPGYRTRFVSWNGLDHDKNVGVDEESWGETDDLWGPAWPSAW